MKYYLLGTSLLLITACQSMYVPQARDIKKKPRNGGVIGMPVSYKPEDRLKAEGLMKQNCNPQAYSVTDEGETVVGQETKTSGSETNRDDSRRKEGDFLGMAIMSGSNRGKETEQSAVTTQLKEWQISYSCEAELKSAKTKK